MLYEYRARCRSCRGRNGDATFLLLLHPVHGGSAFVHLSDAMRLSRIKQDALGRSGLPASMWAMMPMFLQRSNGTVLGTTLKLFLGSKFSFWLLAVSF